MKIIKTTEGGTVTVKVTERLDTTTAPELEEALKSCIDDADSLMIDFSELEYLSSAGLRILLSSQKAMNRKNGKMTLKNPNEIVSEILEVTGFSEFLNIE